MRVVMLLFWWLVILALTASPNAVRAALPTPKSPWPEQVQGFGRTTEAAQKDAVGQALKEVGEYLKQLDPPLMHWQPSEEYLRRKILAGPGRAGADIDIPGLGAARTWTVNLAAPDLETWTRFNREAEATARYGDRLSRGEDRLRIAARVLAAALTVLVGGMVYGRFRNRANNI